MELELETELASDLLSQRYTNASCEDRARRTAPPGTMTTLELQRDGPVLASQAHRRFSENRRRVIESTKQKATSKQGVGKVTGNNKMEAEGKAEHDSAAARREVKGAANQVKGSVEEGLGKVTGQRGNPGPRYGGPRQG